VAELRRRFGKLRPVLKLSTDLEFEVDWTPDEILRQGSFQTDLLGLKFQTDPVDDSAKFVSDGPMRGLKFDGLQLEGGLILLCSVDGPVRD